MKQTIVLLCAVVFVFSLSNTDSASIINNGGFESPNIGGRFITYTSAPAGFDWIIKGSGGYGVDIINYEWQGVSGAINSDGYDQSVDIDYASTLSQSFFTSPGTDYQLHFAYSHNFNASESTGYVDISGSNNLFSATLTHDMPNSSNDMKWILFDSVFTADSEITTLTFTGKFNNGKLGFVLDDVRIKPVPIPGSVLLLGSGLIGLAGFRTKRK